MCIDMYVFKCMNANILFYFLRMYAYIFGEQEFF